MASQQEPIGMVSAFEPATPSPTPTPTAALAPASQAKTRPMTTYIFNRGTQRLENDFNALAPAVRKTLEQCILAAAKPGMPTGDNLPQLSRAERDKFVKTRHADRVSVELHVDNCKVEQEDWPRKTLAERVRWLVARYDEKMRIREVTAASCAKRVFPARYDRVADLMWLVPKYAAYFKEPEKEKVFKEGAVFQIRGLGNSGDDDEEMEEGGEIVVKKKDREEEDSSSEDEDGNTLMAEAKAEVRGKSEENQKRKGADVEMEGGAKKKRKTDAREEKADAQHAMQNGGVATASREKVVYMAVSRRMVVEQHSEVESDSGPGWPWSSAGKTGPFGGGKGV